MHRWNSRTGGGGGIANLDSLTSGTFGHLQLRKLLGSFKVATGVKNYGAKAAFQIEDTTYNRNRRAILDGLRAIAVLLVFLEHSTIGHEFMIRRDMDFAGVGRAGVFLFFILSAYLLTTSLIQSGFTFTYFTRRFLRIAPLYYSVLFGLFIYQSIIGGPDHYRWWMLHYDGGTQGLFDHLLFRKGNFLFWTIPVEVHFYILLPLLWLFLKRFGRVAARLLLVFAIAFGVAAYLVNTRAIEDIIFTHTPFVNSLSSYDVFTFGVLLAWYAPRSEFFYKRYRRLFDLGACVLLVSTIVIAFCVATPHFLWFKLVHPQLIYNSLFFSAAWSAIIISVLNGNRYLNPVLNFRWVRTIGACGFSWYLLHVVVFKLLLQVPLTYTFVNLNRSYINFAISLVCTYLLCRLTYAFIEKPFMKLFQVQNKPAEVSSTVFAVAR